MSMNRICSKCGAMEGIRFNFGQDHKTEAEFHNRDWHDCESCECEVEEDEMFGTKYKICSCRYKDFKI